jgi:hypothetical protein
MHARDLAGEERGLDEEARCRWDGAAEVGLVRSVVEMGAEARYEVGAADWGLEVGRAEEGSDGV